MSPDERTAPVQTHDRKNYPVGLAIPWDLHVRAWQTYAAQGHGDQSAKVIAQRGGFSVGEIIRLLCDRDLFDGRPLKPHHTAHLRDLRERGAEAER